MSLTLTLKTSATTFTGGVNSVAGRGMQTALAVGGTWAVNDTFSLILTTTSGVQTNLGAGMVTGVNFSYVFTYQNKVYGLSGATAYFCALANPATWNDLTGAGNSYVKMSNYFSTPENIVAIAPYQGKLAFYGRQSVQIWSVDADPGNWAQTQIMQNVGTVAPLSVRSIGDRDVFSLADTGIRSIQVRDASNNAIISDVGTPIDSLLQPVLASLTDAQKATACAIVEPSSNRYWCYVPGAGGAVGSIYVFSYFPQSQIAAWSTYTPSYNNGANTFIPEKFFIYGGQVWAREAGSNNFYQYGGADNVSYDNCGVTLQTPYLDGAAPTLQKNWQGFDIAFQGTWAVNVSTDYIANTFGKNIYNAKPTNGSSFHRARSLMNLISTHISLQLVESGTAYARFAFGILHFKPNQPKV